MHQNITVKVSTLGCSAHRIEVCGMVLHNLQHCSSTASLLQPLAYSLAHIIDRAWPALLLARTLLLCPFAAGAAGAAGQLLAEHMVD